jgi:hypothetical protein
MNNHGQDAREQKRSKATAVTLAQDLTAEL